MYYLVSGVFHSVLFVELMLHVVVICHLFIPNDV